MPADPDLFRAGLEYVATLTPIQELFRRPAVTDRLAAALEAMKGSPPMALPGPDRAQLIDLVE